MMPFSNFAVNDVPNLPDADAYVMLSYEGSAGGVVGIAFLGTTCSSDRRLRTGITEYFVDDIMTAQVSCIS